MHHHEAVITHHAGHGQQPAGAHDAEGYTHDHVAAQGAAALLLTDHNDFVVQLLRPLLGARLPKLSLPSLPQAAPGLEELHLAHQQQPHEDDLEKPGHPHPVPR